jgi:hypothetical protein
MIKLSLKQNAYHSLYHAIEHIIEAERSYEEEYQRKFDADAFTVEWKRKDGRLSFYLIDGFCRPDSSYNYKFAILHLIQAAELFLKAFLHSKDPLSIFERSNSRRTITLDESMKRVLRLEPCLLTPEQAGLVLQAKDIRNSLEHFSCEISKSTARHLCLDLIALNSMLSQKFFSVNIIEEFSFDPWTDSEDTVGTVLGTLMSELSQPGIQSSTQIAEIWRNMNPDDILYMCFNCGAKTASVSKGVCLVCGEPTDEEIGKTAMELEELTKQMVKLQKQLGLSFN